MPEVTARAVRPNIGPASVTEFMGVAPERVKISDDGMRVTVVFPDTDPALVTAEDLARLEEWMRTPDDTALALRRAATAALAALDALAPLPVDPAPAELLEYVMDRCELMEAALRPLAGLVLDVGQDDP